jgi:hypothetical protein
VLKNRLSPTDEPFLEGLLDDRRKEVRRAAAQLLSQIPGSGLAERMFARCAGAVSKSGSLLRGPQLQIVPPQETDAAGLRDGLNPKEVWPECGPRGTLLAQMVSAVPPPRWTAHLQLGASRLIELALLHEHGQALLSGWTKAAVAGGNADWLLALAESRLARAEHPYWRGTALRTLFVHLDTDSHNRLAARLLRERTGRNLSDDEPVVQLLFVPRPWNAEVSELVLRNLKRVIEHDTYVYHWGLKNLLKRAALSIPPSWADEAASDWPTGSRHWPSWRIEVEECLHVLRLRRALTDGGPSPDQPPADKDRK